MDVKMKNLEPKNENTDGIKSQLEDQLKIINELNEIYILINEKLEPILIPATETSCVKNVDQEKPLISNIAYQIKKNNNSLIEITNDLKYLFNKIDI